MGAAVVSGGDPPPVLELSEHAFDLVALAIEYFTVCMLCFPGFPGRNAWRCSSCFQRRAEGIAVIPLVADQHGRRRQGVEHQPGAHVVVHLTFGKQQNQGQTVLVHDGMEFGVQPALGAADTAGNAPFLSRLAAVRCALRWVASIIN